MWVGLLTMADGHEHREESKPSAEIPRAAGSVAASVTLQGKLREKQAGPLLLRQKQGPAPRQNNVGSGCGDRWWWCHRGQWSRDCSCWHLEQKCQEMTSVLFRIRRLGWGWFGHPVCT